MVGLRKKRKIDIPDEVKETDPRSDPWKHFRFWGPAYDLYCVVCQLKLFQNGPNVDNRLFMTEGGLALCKRHYDLVSSLTSKNVPVNRWPSNLVRGIGNHFRKMRLIFSNSIRAGEWQIASTPTMKTQFIPTAFFGSSFSPYFSDSFTDYNFVGFPRVNQVVDQNAVASINQTRANIENWQKSLGDIEAQIRRYDSVVDDLKNSNEPRFMTCLKCGQSEMPLEVKNCLFCASNNYLIEGNPIPVPCLTRDVDPDGIVPKYADLVSAQTTKSNSGMSAVFRWESPRTYICSSCFSSFDTNLSRFQCPSCGSDKDFIYASDKAEERELQLHRATLRRERKVDALREEVKKIELPEIRDYVEGAYKEILENGESKHTDLYFPRWLSNSCSYTIRERFFEESMKFVKSEYEAFSGSFSDGGHSEARTLFDEACESSVQEILNNAVAGSNYVGLGYVHMYLSVEYKVVNFLGKRLQSTVGSLAKKLNQGSTTEISQWLEKVKSRKLYGKYIANSARLGAVFLSRHGSDYELVRKYDKVLSSPQINETEKELIDLIEERERSDSTWLNAMDELQKEKGNYSADDMKELWSKLGTQVSRTTAEGSGNNSEPEKPPGSSSDRFCPSCKSKLPHGEFKFCYSCGARLS